MSERPDRQVETGRESGRDGHGVPHEASGDTYGQADMGQGNWSTPGPTHDAAPVSETGPLGQGSEPRVRPDGPSDPAVRQPASTGEPRTPVRDAALGAAAVASGLSNYSSATQYGNQGRYGTPAQYNAEPLVGGELQNGDHPADRPHPGGSGPAHPNG